MCLKSVCDKVPSDGEFLFFFIVIVTRKSIFEDPIMDVNICIKWLKRG